MRTSHLLAALFLALSFCLAPAASAQELAKRTLFKSDSFDFGSGGTVSIKGTPVGSISVEGWNNNRIQIDAEIELSGRTSLELDELAKVTGFVLDESIGHTSITSVGTHDKRYMKRVAKKFPKELLGLPFRIDYVIKVPRYSDLQIDGGNGDLSISGVDGVIRVNFLESNAKLDLIGGVILATIGTGIVDVTIPARNWRGRTVDIALTMGTMNVHLPPGLNAEVDASVLRTGSIENSYPNLQPRIRKGAFTDKLIAARAGNGGISLKFTVGDGALKIDQVERPE
ncbi:MAG: hypothetical protein AB7F88_12875 [Pyrinomonadaceae bacterium]